MSERESATVDNAQIDILTEILPAAITLFRRIDEDSRRRLFQALLALFGPTQDSPGMSQAVIGADAVDPPGDRFSKDRRIGPKEFLLKKQPQTDIERVACLAYYLTHYREQPYFKTLDISKLNTEAAQIKLSNPAKSVNNAATAGYLAQATKGNKQLSAPGELFVEALPERAAAQAAMAKSRLRRKTRQPKRQAS